MAKENFQILSPRPEKLRVARIARDRFSNRIFFDLRKYGRRTLRWLSFWRHVFLVAINCAAWRRLFRISVATHCIVFAPFPWNFLGPILLITKVDCFRTSVAALFSQRVATSGFLRTWHFQVCRVARIGVRSACSRGFMLCSVPSGQMNWTFHWTYLLNLFLTTEQILFNNNFWLRSNIHWTMFSDWARWPNELYFSLKLQRFIIKRCM